MIRAAKCVLYLVHEGVPRILDLDDGGLHKVALLVITVAPGDDGEVGGGPGVVQPLLYASKGLQGPRNQTTNTAGWFTFTEQAEKHLKTGVSANVCNSRLVCNEY